MSFHYAQTPEWSTSSFARHSTMTPLMADPGLIPIIRHKLESHMSLWEGYTCPPVNGNSKRRRKRKFARIGLDLFSLRSLAIRPLGFLTFRSIFCEKSSSIRRWMASHFRAACEV